MEWTFLLRGAGVSAHAQTQALVSFMSLVLTVLVALSGSECLIIT